MVQRKGVRYRRIETNLWVTEFFRALSPGGQFLCLYLRTGPHTTNVPGIWPVGPDALAERLNWSRKKFRFLTRMYARERG